MKILLLTDIVPRADTSPGIFLNQLCAALPPRTLAVFVARDGAVAGQSDPALNHVPHRFAFKPGELGLVGARAQKIYRLAGMVREYGRRVVRVPPLINQAIEFGREQQVDAVWALVTGQTIARMARGVAKGLRAPLYVQLPDSFEARLVSRFVDPLNRRAATQVLERCVQDSVSCAVSTGFMAEHMRRIYGADAHILYPAVASELLKQPAAGFRRPGELVIGFAGSAYKHEEWNHLVGALEEHNWQVNGRRVSVLTYGHVPPPTPGPPGRVLHRHFVPERELVEALSAEADLLYLPQPFAAPFAESAKARIPQKLVSYLAAGRPIVFHGPVESAAYRILRTAEAGAFAPGADRVSIWSALSRISASESLYGAVARAGHQLASSDFGPHVQRRQLSRFLIGADTGDIASARPLSRPLRSHPVISGQTSGTLGAAPSISEAASNGPHPHPAIVDAERLRVYALEADLQRAQSSFEAVSRELAESRERLTMALQGLRPSEGAEASGMQGLHDSLSSAVEATRAREYTSQVDLHRVMLQNDQLATQVSELQAALDGQLAAAEMLTRDLEAARAREYTSQVDLHRVMLQNDQLATQVSELQAALDGQLAAAEMLTRDLTRQADLAEKTGALHYVSLAASQRSEERTAVLLSEAAEAREELESQIAYLEGVAEAARRETGAVERKLEDVVRERAAETALRLEEQGRRIALEDQVGFLERGLDLSKQETRAVERKLEDVVRERAAETALRLEEQGRRIALEDQVGFLERGLDLSKQETRAVEQRLGETVQERIALAHAVQLAEVQAAGTVGELNVELSRARAELDRIVGEKAARVAEGERLQERCDSLMRELQDTRLELVAQNVRLANVDAIMELREQLAALRASPGAEHAEARARDSEQRTTLAEETLAAVQRAHVDEVRAGIEFVSRQIADAKALEAAEGRIAGRFSLLAADVADVKKGLLSGVTGDQRGALKLRTLYLDLLESSLCGMLSSDPNMDRWSDHAFDRDKRLLGRDWPRTAVTMIGAARMRNVRTLVERTIEDGIEGDFLEAGVWRGGACIYMKGILLAHGQPGRRIWLADSFKGLPLPEPELYPADQADQHHEYEELRVTAEGVRGNFEAYGLLDDNVKFLEGWFKDTLPTAPIDKLALLRLDGDMYSSTMESLESLYDKVVPGGFVIVDDYILAPCRKAITDFREARGIADAIEEIDGAAIYWRKAAVSGKSGASRVGRVRPVKADVAPSRSRA